MPEMDRIHKWVCRHLSERAAYRYAEFFGQHPACSECGKIATFILWPEAEARCLKHSGMGSWHSTSVVGMVRDVTPADHFGDDYEMNP